MYKDVIRELRTQKREVNREILIDFIKIYLKLVIGFPGLVKEREDLVILVQKYFDADRNECEVLSYIEKLYGKVDDYDEKIYNLLADFDDMFVNLYNHVQRTFLDYEEVIEEYGDFIDWITLRIRCSLSGEPYEPAKDIRYRMTHYPIQFPVFNASYKQKMIEYISSLPIPEKVEF